MESISERGPSVASSLGGRRGRLCDNVTQPGTRARSASVSSAGSFSSGLTGSVTSQQLQQTRGWLTRREARASGERQTSWDIDGNFTRELASQLRWRNRNLLELSQAFLPTLVSEALLRSAVHRMDLVLPLTESRSGCVAKINCSGLVELTARLEQHMNGAAMLSRCINRFYTHIIDIVMAYQGDIVRFNANTFVVFFEAASELSTFRNACGSKGCMHTPMDIACLRAAACCVELHKHLHHVDVGEGSAELTLSVGVGAGSISVMVVQGGPSTESETSNKYTVSGAPLDQASLAETLAGKCETVFSPQAWKHVAYTVLEGQPVKGQPDFHRCVAFDTRRHTYPMVRHAALQSVARDSAFPLGSRPKSATVRRCLALLMNFLPDSVLRHLWAGTLSNVNELRMLSIAFLYIKGLDPSVADGARTVSRIVAELQRAAFAEEGFLHRFLVDEQGLLVQFAFGVPPLVHTDDPLRACRASAKMLSIASRFHVSGHAGVATGRLFCGLVGSDRRHEYGIVGSAVQLALGLSGAAEASTVLADQVTHESCETELDFESVEVGLGQDDSTVQAFRMLTLRAERELRLESSPPMSRKPSRQGWPAQRSHLQSYDGVDHTPCTPPASHPPPWLTQSRREGRPVVQWEQPIPTLWTHICVERPLPPAPSRGPSRPPSKESQGGEPPPPPAESVRPWRTHIKVPLPWPARSAACGGVSPLPNLNSWRHLQDAELAVDDCTHQGGGLLVLAGPFGCGKTELTEHLVTRAVKVPARAQPIFGAMEVRVGHCWAAICGVLRSALALLQPSGRIHSTREFSELLRREVTSQWEERALVMAGLVDLTTEALGAEAESSYATSAESFPGRTSVRSTAEHEAFLSDKDTQPLVDLAMRLVERLLGRGSIVVALRISQGTSLLTVEMNGFWLLARALGALAMERRGFSTEHSLLVLVTCREPHVPPDMTSRVMRIGPLTGQEVQRYIHLCLGLTEDPGDRGQQTLRAAACLSDFPPEQEHMDGENQEESLLVPEVLLHWLRRIADLPRHLEEGLTQLRQVGVIAINGGRCVVNADMELLSTADWIHTHMVGRIISQMEAMVPEMQHVLQIATVLPGPFSSLDLAAAIRVHLAWDTPNMMALFLCVKHLLACGELVRAGFLRRIDLPDSLYTDDFAKLEELNGMPCWVVTSFLIQEVVSSTVLQGMRMQLKRAILLSRATERLRWTRNASSARSTHRPSDASFCSEAARSAKVVGKNLKSLRQGPRKEAKSVRPPGAPMDVNVSNIKYWGLPSSCIVTSNLTDGISRADTQVTSGIDSEDISFEVPPRVDSSFKRGARKALSSSCVLLLRLPWRLMRQCIILTILAVVLLYPDLWIILEGTPGNLDFVMLLALCLFALDMLHCFLYDDTYTYRSLFTDLVLLVCILLDVSWAMGRPITDLALQRRDPGSMWRLIALYIKFGACAVRLTVYIRSMAGLLHRGYEMRVKNRKTTQVDTEKATATQMLENISNSLTHAILMNFVSLTILIIVSVQVVDMFSPPDEDSSMQSWVQLLSQEASINSSAAASSLQGELHRFQEFYRDMGYGPYNICLGINPLGSSFDCQSLLWQSQDGSDYTDPRRQSFQLDVHSATVRASFDFSGPAKHEALMRMMIISTTVFCMVFVALSLDYVANALIVAPLARLMPTVRQVMVELREKFPSLEHQDKGEECDEVAAFEEMVQKITLIVTMANKNMSDTQDTGMASEWINGMTSQKGSPSSYSSMRPSRILTHLATEVPTNDVRRLQKLGVSYELLDSWDFDVLALDKAQLSGVTGWVLLDCANPYLALQPHVVASFLDAMVEEYRDENSYHNWWHACDVLHGVFRSCMLNQVTEFASRVDVFALLVAAISHDAGHPGLNNIFLVQTSHELALRYNDVSPLENMHCSTMFGLLSSRPKANVFGMLSREQYREARQVCIETILHTDNAKHFEMVKELQMFYHTNSDVFEKPSSIFPSAAEAELLGQTKNRRLALQAVLHGADISNPCKPWGICESWANLVLGEFFAQGDKERALGIAVQPLNNRETVNKPSSQVAFIEFFIYPFNTALVKVLTPLWEMSGNLSANLQKWHAMRTAEEQEKAEPKVQAICEDLQAVINSALAETRQPSKATIGAAESGSPRGRADSPTPKLNRASTWGSDMRVHPSPMRSRSKNAPTDSQDLPSKFTRYPSCHSETAESARGADAGSPKHGRDARDEMKEVSLPNTVPNET